MLTGLLLQNIALIESLELEFSSGFTVLTGETGAGKSILLDALDAVLGGAQGSSGVRLLRTGSDRARIEAAFQLNPALEQWLIAAEFDPEEELLISREWKRQEGDRYSSRCRLNGSTVNRQQLLELRPLLIDLTVQGQTQLLSRAGQQRLWLDRLGGSALAELKVQVADAWTAWRQAADALMALELEQQRSEQEQAEQEEQLEQLQAADLDDPDEQQRLEQDQDRLVHGVRLLEGLALLFGRLRDGVDQAPSLQDHFAACIQELQAMAQLDGSLEPLRDQALESDPDHLERIQDRLSVLKRLQRRYGLDLAGLIQRRDELLHRLGSEGFAADLARLQQAETVRRQTRDQANAALRRERFKAAEALEASLLKLLPPMGLANVRFKVDLTPCDPAEHGADAVQFLFSANPGQPMAPLTEVASGGEMSRFLLALKTTLAAVDGSSTLLFDEIDAGVSGRVSGAMADLLQTLARQRQVFCVTHQPLVAAVADHHFRVSKHVEDGITHSRVSRLRDTQERRQELADLAGGDQADAYAASLLDQRTA